MSNDDKKISIIPNSTQIPNILTDGLLPRLSEAEMKCLLYICRRTFGFHRDEDRISLSQFVDGQKAGPEKKYACPVYERNGEKYLDFGAGLSRQSAVIGLRNLEQAEAIQVRRTSVGNTYKINLEMDIEKVVNLIDQSRKLTRSGLKNRPKVVHLLDTQKKGKERENNMRPENPSAHRGFIDWYYEAVKKIRNVKLIITGADGRNLKRVLGLISPNQLQQFAVCYLASPTFKQFSPGISTFLSAGVLNQIMNRAQSDPDFWKRLDGYVRLHLDNQEFNKNEMVEAINKLKDSFKV